MLTLYFIYYKGTHHEHNEAKCHHETNMKSHPVAVRTATG